MLKKTSYLPLLFLLTSIHCGGCPASKQATQPTTNTSTSQTPTPAQPAAQTQNQAFEMFKKLFLQSYLPQDILPGDESMEATLPANAIESMPVDYAGDPNQYKPTNPFLAGSGCCEFYPAFNYESTSQYVALIYRQTNGIGEGSEYFVLVTYTLAGQPIDNKIIALQEGDIEFQNIQTATLEGGHSIAARKTETKFMIADSGEQQPTSKKETFITYKIGSDGKISATESATPQ
ncbi:hypothetical protein K1X76_06460 [bacterium]|nr:hypothetical protein [bacterium]